MAWMDTHKQARDHMTDSPEPIVLSHNQERRLLRDAEYGRARTPHHSISYIACRPWPNVVRLRSALAQVINNHVVLKSTFQVSQGVAKGFVDLSVLPEDDVAVRTHDLREQPQACQSYATSLAEQLFDLERGPLVRLDVILIDAETAHLLLTVDHIVCDGLSLWIILRELSTAYNGSETSGPAQVTMMHWARDEREQIQGESLHRKLAYWRSRLDPLEAVPEYRFPGMREPKELGRRSAALVSRTLSDNGAEGLRMLARSFGVSSFTVSLAILGRYLNRTYGISNVGVVTPLGVRSERWSEVVGWLSDLTIVRFRVDQGDDLASTARKAQAALLGAMENSLPLPVLVQHLQPWRDMVRTWRPWLYFATTAEAQATSTIRLEGCKVTPLVWDVATGVKDGLGVWMTPLGPGEGTLLVAQWEAEAWSRRHGERFASGLTALLESAALA